MTAAAITAAPSATASTAHRRAGRLGDGWVEGSAPGMLGGPYGDALFIFTLPE